MQTEKISQLSDKILRFLKLSRSKEQRLFHWLDRKQPFVSEFIRDYPAIIKEKSKKEGNNFLLDSKQQQLIQRTLLFLAEDQIPHKENKPVLAREILIRNYAKSLQVVTDLFRQPKVAAKKISDLPIPILSKFFLAFIPNLIETKVLNPALSPDFFAGIFTLLYTLDSNKQEKDIKPSTT